MLSCRKRIMTPNPFTQRIIRGQVFALTLIVVLWLILARAAPAQAAGVVADCSSDTDLTNKLVGGGLVTFNCGGTHSAATIQMGSGKDITVNTTIEGGGLLTLDGHNATRQFQVSSGAALTLSNITLVNGYADPANSTGHGGCILVGNNSQLVLLNVTILNCHTPDGYSGGGIYVSVTASLSMLQSTLSGSSAGSGGGILNLGTAMLTHSAVLSNTATQNGGGIKNSGTATLENSILSANSASNGGGMSNSGGTVTLDHSTVAGNQTLASGGGIFNSGNATLYNSTLSNNLAVSGGGGIANTYLVTLTNVTLSSNTAGFGGGIANLQTMTLTNATLAANSASDGEGIYQFGGSAMSLKNSIIAYSASGGNCSGSITSSQYSISSDSSCTLIGPGNQSGIDPLLSALDNYGGPTLVYMPRLGSPAIEGGTSTGAPAADQRGVARPQPPAGLYDIGSVERRSTDSDFPPRLYLPVVLR
jgi:hypothetical protein